MFGNNNNITHSQSYYHMLTVLMLTLLLWEGGAVGNGGADQLHCETNATKQKSPMLLIAQL
jgi:hypothetical protein